MPETTTNLATCECVPEQQRPYTDEKFRVRCADCHGAIVGAVDAWSRRFRPSNDSGAVSFWSLTAALAVVSSAAVVALSRVAGLA